MSNGQQTTAQTKAAVITAPIEPGFEDMRGMRGLPPPSHETRKSSQQTENRKDESLKPRSPSPQARKLRWHRSIAPEPHNLELALTPLGPWPCPWSFLANWAPQGDVLLHYQWQVAAVRFKIVRGVALQTAKMRLDGQNWRRSANS